MRPFIALYELVHRFARFAALAGMVALIGAVLLTVADILLRQLLGLAVIGTLDMVQLCVMTAVFLAIPYGFLAGSHVAIEMATDPLPPRVLALVKAAAAFAGCGFMAAVCWFGLEQAALQHSYGDASQTIGIGIIYDWLPLLAGAFLSTLATATLAARLLVEAASGVVPIGPERPA